MKIAVLGNVTHPLHEPFYRGVERFTHGLAKKLIQKGHEVTLFSKENDLPCETIPILSEHENHKLAKLSEKPATNWEQIDNIKRKGHLAVMKKIAKGKFDIVHNNSLDTFPLLASQKLNTLMITTLHAPPTAEHVYMFQEMRRNVHSYFCATSYHIKNIWKQRAEDLDIAVIHNGVLDLEEEISLNFKEAQNKALWVGRITPDKGLHHAIKACHLAGVALSFSGAVDDTDYFENTIRNLMGNNDEYLGNLTRDELRAEMENSRVGIATPQYEEPCGLSAMEMLSCGLPIVSYKRGAITEIINDTNGYLAAPQDVADLAYGINSIKDLCKVKIQQNTIRKYNLETMVVKYEKVYNFLRALHEKDRKEQAYWYLYSSSKQRTLA